MSQAGFGKEFIRLQLLLENIYDGHLENHPQKYRPCMPFLLKLKKDVTDTGKQFQKLRKDAFKEEMKKENQETDHGFKNLGLAYFPTSV